MRPENSEDDFVLVENDSQEEGKTEEEGDTVFVGGKSFVTRPFVLAYQFFATTTAGITKENDYVVLGGNEIRNVSMAAKYFIDHDEYFWLKKFQECLSDFGKVAYLTNISRPCHTSSSAGFIIALQHHSQCCLTLKSDDGCIEGVDFNAHTRNFDTKKFPTIQIRSHNAPHSIGGKEQLYLSPISSAYCINFNNLHAKNQPDLEELIDCCFIDLKAFFEDLFKQNIVISNFYAPLFRDWVTQEEEIKKQLDEIAASNNMQKCVSPGKRRSLFG